jgi:trimethylamine--corrinoid protein Co-methyltransferase
VDPADVDPKDKHLHIMYETIKNTDKPINGYCVQGYQARQMLDMVEIAMGRKGFLEENHAVGVSINSLSPLAFGEDVLETLIEYARRRQPVLILPCILAGASGPVSLIGTAVQQNTEILAGLVLIQLISPGSPAVYCPASTAANMKTGGYVTGPPEAFLINIANLQQALDLYHLPTRVMCGMTDAKEVDCQAGFETMQNLMMATLAGAHILHESLGVLDSVMCTSYEKFIIDQELLSRAMRICKGLDTSVEALSIDIIQERARMGEYLTHDSTLQHCRDYWTPTVSTWDSYDEWEEAGSEGLLVRANKRFKEILKSCPETLIDPDLDRDLKAYIEHVLQG